MVLALMGIGLAGAGKSTVLKALARAYGLAYVSRDDFVEARCGNPHDQRFRNEAGVQADWATLTACAAGVSVALDSTFVEASKRCAKIRFLRTVGARRIIGLFFDVPFSLAQERNGSRRFIVSRAVLERQYLNLTAHPPCIEDGFDRVYRFEELEELKQAEFA